MSLVTTPWLPREHLVTPVLYTLEIEMKVRAVHINVLSILVQLLHKRYHKRGGWYVDGLKLCLVGCNLHQDASLLPRFIVFVAILTAFLPFSKKALMKYAFVSGITFLSHM